MSAGKGSSPRNLGPKFRENYDAIFRKPKKGTQEMPKPSVDSKRTVAPHP
jgi:hypothetical protein